MKTMESMQGTRKLIEHIVGVGHERKEIDGGCRRAAGNIHKFFCIIQHFQAPYAFFCFMRRITEAKAMMMQDKRSNDTASCQGSHIFFFLLSRRAKAKATVQQEQPSPYELMGL